MNPHDMAKRPGAHFVAEEFGVEDPWALSDDHPPRDPLHLVGRMVAEAARDVDELHSELTRAAQSAIELLEPFGRGDSAGLRGWDGVLRTAGPQIDLLAARRSAAFEQLNQAVSTYHRLLHESDAEPASKAPRQSLGLAPEQAPGRNDDWAIAGGRQLGALEAVEAGGLRFHQSAAYGYIYLSDGRGQRPNPEVWPETVRRWSPTGYWTRTPARDSTGLDSSSRSRRRARRPFEMHVRPRRAYPPPSAAATPRRSPTSSPIQLSHPQQARPPSLPLPADSRKGRLPCPP